MSRHRIIELIAVWMIVCQTPILAAKEQDLAIWQHDPQLVKSPAAQLTRQADALLTRLDIGSALPLYTKALSQDPKFGPAYRGRAYALLQMNETEAALADLGKGVTCDNFSSLLCRRDRAELNIALKNYSPALADLNVLIPATLQPDGLFVQRAHCLIGLRQPERAIADINQVLKTHIKNWLLRERARAYIEAHQYKNALDDYTTMIARSKSGDATVADDSILYKERAEVYDCLGKKSLAQRDRDMAAAAEKDMFSISPFSANSDDFKKPHH
jgi:tetratricopeptide (TPR) repeat protein